MTRVLLRLLLAVTVLGAVLATAEDDARADDYACSIIKYPAAANTTYGQHGYLYVTYYDEPDCAGNLSKQLYFCTLGATSSNCALPQYSCVDPRMTELEINTVADMLLRAAYQGKALYAASCGAPSNHRGAWHFWYAYGFL